jgi:hypothetical protein
MNSSGLITLNDNQLIMIDGGKGVANFVSGVTAIAAIVGVWFPPALLVAGIGGLF